MTPFFKNNLILFFAVLAIIIGTSAISYSAPPSVTILFSGDMRGEIEPCYS